MITTRAAHLDNLGEHRTEPDLECVCFALEELMTLLGTAPLGFKTSEHPE